MGKKKKKSKQQASKSKGSSSRSKIVKSRQIIEKEIAKPSKPKTIDELVKKTPLKPEEQQETQEQENFLTKIRDLYGRVNHYLFNTRQGLTYFIGSVAGATTIMLLTVGIIQMRENRIQSTIVNEHAVESSVIRILNPNVNNNMVATLNYNRDLEQEQTFSSEAEAQEFYDKKIELKAMYDQSMYDIRLCLAKNREENPYYNGKNNEFYSLDDDSREEIKNIFDEIIENKDFIKYRVINKGLLLIYKTARHNLDHEKNLTSAEYEKLTEKTN